MKFLCGNCKAKYQIPDHKVSGRTLRMTCRRCGEEILIRGKAVAAQAQSAARQAASRASSPSAAPLSAGFQRQVVRPSAPPSPPVKELWHVAIDDTPVGPIRREELARKITSGTVDGDSLAWCEGMDEWQPIADIPELAPLVAAPPPAAGSIRPQARSNVVPLEGRKATAPSVSMPPAAPAAPTTRSAAPPAAAAVESSPEPAPATAAATATPQAGATPASHVSSTAGPQVAPTPAAAHTPSVVTPIPAGVAGLPQRESVAGEPVPASGPSWGPMLLLVCGGAFIMAVGMVLGAKLLSPSETPSIPDPTAATKPSSAPTPAAEATLDMLETETAPETAAVEDEAPSERVAAAASSGSRSSKRGSRKRRHGPRTKGGDGLSEAERQMLKRMSGRGVASKPTPLAEGGSTKRSPPRPGLKAAQLRAVVTKQRRHLQRCYETALRATGTEDQVKLDVKLTVGSRGTVKSVKITGRGLPGLATCIRRSVKTWRFPAAPTDTHTGFPLVFQPGA